MDTALAALAPSDERSARRRRATVPVPIGMIPLSYRGATHRATRPARCRLVSRQEMGGRSWKRGVGSWEVGDGDALARIVYSLGTPLAFDMPVRWTSPSPAARERGRVRAGCRFRRPHVRHCWASQQWHPRADRVLAGYTSCVRHAGALDAALSRSAGEGTGEGRGPLSTSARTALLGKPPVAPRAGRDLCGQRCEVSRSHALRSSGSCHPDWLAVAPALAAVPG